MVGQLGKLAGTGGTYRDKILIAMQTINEEYRYASLTRCIHSLLSLCVLILLQQTCPGISLQDVL